MPASVFILTSALCALCITANLDRQMGLDRSYSQPEYQNQNLSNFFEIAERSNGNVGLYSSCLCKHVLRSNWILWRRWQSMGFFKMSNKFVLHKIPDPVNEKLNYKEILLLKTIEVWGPSGPRLLFGSPSGFLNSSFVPSVLRPCDPRLPSISQAMGGHLM